MLISFEPFVPAHLFVSESGCIVYFNSSLKFILIFKDKLLNKKESEKLKMSSLGRFICNLYLLKFQIVPQ